jgi:hypothetical protein
MMYALSLLGMWVSAYLIGRAHELKRQLNEDKQ